MGFGQFAVHVDEANGAGALVQVVHVLGAEKEAVADALLKFGKREVGRIGLGLCCRGAARGVELPDQRRIALPGIGSADILDAIACP